MAQEDADFKSRSIKRRDVQTFLVIVNHRTFVQQQLFDQRDSIKRREQSPTGFDL